MTADLPEWAMEKALEIAHQLMLPDDDVFAVSSNTIATALVSAAKAERERAAGIAESWGKTARSLGQIEAETIADDIASCILADGGPDG